MTKERYICAEDLVDWMNVHLPADAEKTIAAIEDYLRDAPCMVGGVVVSPEELPQYNPPDEFDRADFLHDDLEEDYWND